MGRDQDGGATEGVVSPVGDVVEYVFHGYSDDTLEEREEVRKRKEKSPKIVERVGVGLLVGRRGLRSKGMCQVTAAKRGQSIMYRMLRWILPNYYSLAKL